MGLPPKGKGDVLGSMMCSGEIDHGSTGLADEGDHGIELCNGRSDDGSMAFTGKELDHGSKEIDAQHVEVIRPVTAKPSDEDEEEAELLTILVQFRQNWEELYSQFFGPVDGISPEIGPKHYTDSGPPRRGAIEYDAMEIFSIKVIEIKEGIEWPVRVFGLIAVRDSMDYKRNILFQRSKENYQTITAEDCSLELIGPSRAIALIDPPEFEVELSFIGSNQAEEKSLCAAVFTYNNIVNARFGGRVRNRVESTKRSTIELKYAHLDVPLEATIEIHHYAGSRDFHGEFFAYMKYMDEDKILLLDSTDRTVNIKPDGKIPLSRCVVLVKEGAELILGVKAWQGEDYLNAVVSRAVFPAKLHSKSDGDFSLPFCKMSVSVFWSVLC